MILIILALNRSFILNKKESVQYSIPSQPHVFYLKITMIGTTNHRGIACLEAACAWRRCPL